MGRTSGSLGLVGGGVSSNPAFTGNPSRSTPKIATATQIGILTNARIVDANSGINIWMSGVGTVVHFLWPLTSNVFDIVLAVQLVLPSQGGFTGILSQCLRESSSGKLWTWGYESVAGSSASVLKWSDATTIATQVQSWSAFTNFAYFRITSDGTTRKAFESIDGENWIQLYSATANDYIVPDQAGITYQFKTGAIPVSGVEMLFAIKQLTGIK